MDQLKMKSNTGIWKKQIALFLISQNISLFGSSVVSFAITLHITLTTSSGFWIMMSTICSMMPQVIISLFGGVWADRCNRKFLIMISDGFIALTTLALAISYLVKFRRLELVLIASVIRSAGAGVQMPAVNAIYPQLVSKEKLTKVQAINQTLNSILTLLAPAVGGLLLGTIGIVAAFFVDVISATAAILIMSGIHIDKSAQQPKQISIWKDLKGGLIYSYHNIPLRHIIICYIFTYFLITPSSSLGPLMIKRTFGNEVWRLTANEIVWTAGSIIGGVYISFKGEFKNKVKALASSIIAFGIFFTLLGISWNFTVYLIFMGIAGLFLPVMVTAQTVHIQEITDPSMLGRVFSIVQLIPTSAIPVAILLFGPLADVISVESILIVTGILLTLVGYLYKKSDSQTII